MVESETPGRAEPRRDGRRDRWSKHRATRRAELLNAVLAAVRELGPGVDMDDVAAVSGVAKPVFYRYFKDKADLYVAVGAEVGERLVAEVITALADRDRPRDMLAAAIETFLSAVEADPDVYRFVLQRPTAAPAANDYSAVISKHVSLVIGDLLRSAGRDAGMAEPWGFAMVGAVRSAAERWLDEPTLSRSALAAYLTELLWNGSRGARSATVSVPLRRGPRPA